MASVVRHGSPALCALLSCKGRCGMQPWVELLQRDLGTLKGAFASKLADLGDPIADAQKWCLFVQSFPNAWNTIVGNLFFSESPFDAADAPNPLFFKVTG